MKNKIEKIDERDTGYESFQVFYKEGWHCSMELSDESEDIPLVLVTKSLDMYEATGEDEFKDYPISPEIGILNKNCHVSISENMSGQTSEELGLEYADICDVDGYFGFACYMLQRFIDTDKLNKDLTSKLPIGDAALFSYECRFTGKTKYYPRFKTLGACDDFMEVMVREYGDMFMTLVGFELDRPVNLMGETAWSTIQRIHEGV